jgi:hypothetical protein
VIGAAPGAQSFFDLLTRTTLMDFLRCPAQRIWFRLRDLSRNTRKVAQKSYTGSIVARHLQSLVAALSTSFRLIDTQSALSTPK